MRLYPELAAVRTKTIARDVAVLLAVVAFAWLGFKVHDGVDELSVLGRGVGDAGGAVQRGFSSAAGSVEGTPLVGGKLSGALRDAGLGSGGRAQAAGRAGEERVHELAALLGWLTFLVPTGLLLARVIPGRIAQARRLTAAARALAGPDTPERRRLLAMRAAFSLPYATLVRHTRDPLGDLEAGRHDALIAAALEDAGLANPPYSVRSTAVPSCQRSKPASPGAVPAPASTSLA
jgi:hypothetical protein